MPALFVKFSRDSFSQGVFGIIPSSLISVREVTMKDYVKYGRARGQLYSYKVGIRQLHQDIPAKRRTNELVQLMEMVENLVDVVCHALEREQIVAMQLDLYELLPLPGLEELMDDSNENPYKP